MKLDARDLIFSPLVTEKTTQLKDEKRVLCFKVHPHANKIMIKKAVEEIFKTRVDWVRVMSLQGKEKRYGRYSGRRPTWKKAYVKLKPDAKMIEYVEVV